MSWRLLDGMGLSQTVDSQWCLYVNGEIQISPIKNGTIFGLTVIWNWSWSAHQTPEIPIEDINLCLSLDPGEREQRDCHVPSTRLDCIDLSILYRISLLALLSGYLQQSTNGVHFRSKCVSIISLHRSMNEHCMTRSWPGWVEAFRDLRNRAQLT